MRGMDALKKLWMIIGAAGACLVLLVVPVAAEEEPVEDAPMEEPAAEAPATDDAEEGSRRPIAETPRDRIGLILLGALIIGGGAAAANARRQMKGERPQATGEFRWR